VPAVLRVLGRPPSLRARHQTQAQECRAKQGGAWTASGGKGNDSRRAFRKLKKRESRKAARTRELRKQAEKKAGIGRKNRTPALSLHRRRCRWASPGMRRGKMKGSAPLGGREQGGAKGRGAADGQAWVVPVSVAGVGFGVGSAAREKGSVQGWAAGCAWVCIDARDNRGGCGGLPQPPKASVPPRAMQTAMPCHPPLGGKGGRQATGVWGASPSTA